MEQPTIDILMITYNRPHYTSLSLKQLLDTCDETMRVWIWHNGNDGPTLEVVRSLASHPSVYEFHVSSENKKLNEPTNWLWANAKGKYLSKVDDDCLLPKGWAQTLREAHEDVTKFGVIGCWPCPEEDFYPEQALKKINRFHHKYMVMQNTFIQGHSYLIKKKLIDSFGLLGPSDTFPSYCQKIAFKGWIVGWYYPFIYVDHMDDPRSKNTGLKTEEDFQKHKPLTAIKNKCETLKEWDALLRKSSIYVQKEPYDPSYYSRWRKALRKLFRLIKLLHKKLQ